MRILMAFQPVPGHLNPSVGVAQALRDRGHEVAFYSGAEARSYVEQNGFAFYPFEASLNERLMRILFPPEGSATAGNIVDQRHALLRPGKVNAALREWFLDTIPEQITDLERLYDEFQPDLLVSDVTLMGPILILKDRSAVPVALLSVTSSCPIPGPEVAPWGLGMPPARSALRRVQYQVVQRVSRWISAGFRREADLLRLRYELPPLKGAVADEYARVPLFLVVGTPSLDYNRRDLPGCVRYVGLCAAQARGRQTAPDWLESLPAGEPVVHVTEGTVYCNEPVLLRAAVEGLSGLPMRVILSTGKHRRPEELNLGRIGPNVIVEQFVPHDLLFPKTSVFVSAGNAGADLKAVLAGVPLVVVPTGWDHMENALRVVDAGVGILLPPEKCDGAGLRRAVETVLRDPSYRANALRVSREACALGGSERAADLLEETFGRQAVSSPPCRR